MSTPETPKVPTPYLLSFKSDKPTDEPQSFIDGMADLAIGGIKAVADNLIRQLRYGRIKEGPVSVDYLDSNLEPIGFVRCVNVVIICPINAVDKIPELVKQSIETVFKADGDR